MSAIKGDGRTQLHRFYDTAGNPLNFYAAPALFPIKRNDADLAFDRLRETMYRRIDGAFACHARHHMNDIARRFEYLERPELRIYEEEMRRIVNGISLAYMRGEIPIRGKQ